MAMTSQSSEPLDAVGVIADLGGSEPRFVKARPVVMMDGRHFVAMREAWSVEDLVLVDESQLEFVTRTPHRVSIQSGVVGVIASDSFRWRLSDIESLAPVANRMKLWMRIDPNHVLAFQTPQEFSDFSMHVYQHARAALHQMLFDGLEYSVGTVRRVFDVVDSVRGVEAGDQHIQRGLFYHQDRDDYGYQLSRLDAVRDGAFVSAASFDAAVSQLVEFLGDQRLRELAVHQRYGGSRLDAGSATDMAEFLLFRAVASSGSKLEKRMHRFFQFERDLSSLGSFEEIVDDEQR